MTNLTTARYAAAIELLRAAHEAFDGYVDTTDGPDGQPRPNPAMRVAGEIERFLAVEDRAAPARPTRAPTPGPWQVIDGHVYAPTSRVAPFTDSNGVHHADFRTGLIALVYGTTRYREGEQDGDAKANAALMAAAPDLLRELKWLRERFRSCCAHAGMTDPEMLDAATVGADAAIVKAEGRA